MKRFRWALLLCLALLLIAGGAAAGEDVIDGDINKAAGSLEIPFGRTVNGNVTVNMGEVEILGTVNGNVDSNMGQITVHGEVNGNVEANMGQVLILGSVSGDVAARMGEVIVDGAVGGNVKAELGEVKIRGTVAGNVDVGLGELRIPGEVLGNVTSQGKSLIITGRVGGNVDLYRGIVELGPESEIGGRVHVERGMARISEGAHAGAVDVDEELAEAEIDRVFGSRGYRFRGLDGFEGAGDILENVFESIGRAFSNIKLLPGGWRGSFPGISFGWSGHVARGLLNMVVIFALAALTFSLFPRHVQSTGRIIFDQPGTVIGWGLLALVLAVPLLVLLAITIIGIPLIFVEILALALAGILGYTALSGIVGEKIIGAASPGTANSLGAIALGVLVLGAISMVPWLGSLFSLLLFVLAVGASLATRFGTQNQVPAVPAGAVVETGRGEYGKEKKDAGENDEPEDI